MRPSYMLPSFFTYADGSVTTAMVCRLGIRIPVAKILLLYLASRPTLGPVQCPIQWVPEANTQEVKRLGCEADYQCRMMELYFH
jgi:hypothetical protein